MERATLPGVIQAQWKFLQLLTRANETELKSQAGFAYRVVKQRKPGAPERMKLGTRMYLQSQSSSALRPTHRGGLTRPESRTPIVPSPTKPRGQSVDEGRR